MGDQEESKYTTVQQTSKTFDATDYDPNGRSDAAHTAAGEFKSSVNGKLVQTGTYPAQYTVYYSTPGTTLEEAAFEEAVAKSDELIAFDREVFEWNKLVSERQIELAESQAAIGEEQWAIWKDLYLPIEQELTRDYKRDPSVDAARAGADVTQSFNIQRESAMRDLERMGINPSSPKYASLLNDLTIAEAAAEAGAKTNARLQSEELNKAFGLSLIQTGRGLQSAAGGSYGTAIAGLSAGAQTSVNAAGLVNAGYNSSIQANQALGGYYGDLRGDRLQQEAFGLQWDMQTRQIDQQENAAQWGAVGSAFEAVGLGAGAYFAPGGGKK